MKRLLPILIILMLSQACTINRRKTVVNRYPSELAGIQELVLAIQDENIVLTDTIQAKKWWTPFKSKAVVTVMVPVTYKYYIDLKQEYSMNFSGAPGKEVLHFRAPALTVQDPIIHGTEAVVRKKGLLVNEQKAINRILSDLPNQLSNQKKEKIDEQTRRKCEEELRVFLMNFCKESGVPVKEVKIKFGKGFLSLNSLE